MITWVIKDTMSAASWNNSLAYLDHGCRGLWLFGQLNTDIYFLRQLCMRRPPRDSSQTCTILHSWACDEWGLVDFWDVAKASCFLFLYKVLDLFLVLIFSAIIFSFAPTLQSLPFWWNIKGFKSFTSVIFLLVLTVQLSKSSQNHPCHGLNIGLPSKFLLLD